MTHISDRSFLGGFIPLAQYVKYSLGLDYAYANQLGISSDGRSLTGETYGPIVDGLRKAELLDVIAQSEGLTNSQVKLFFFFFLY